MCLGRLEAAPDLRYDNGVADAGGHAAGISERCRGRTCTGSRAPAGANGSERKEPGARSRSACVGRTDATAGISADATAGISADSTASISFHAIIGPPIRPFGGACAIRWRGGADAIPVRDSPTSLCPEHGHPIVALIASQRHTPAACTVSGRSCRRRSAHAEGAETGAVRSQRRHDQTCSRAAEWRAAAPKRTCARDVGMRKLDVAAASRSSRRAWAGRG
jgi:hypothetical protein